MKLTTRKLKQMIREELNKINESNFYLTEIEYGEKGKDHDELGVLYHKDFQGEMSKLTKRAAKKAGSGYAQFSLEGLGRRGNLCKKGFMLFVEGVFETYRMATQHSAGNHAQKDLSLHILVLSGGRDLGPMTSEWVKKFPPDEYAKYVTLEDAEGRCA